MAASETPRLVVLNQDQMLPSFYATNLHRREPTDSARCERGEE